MAAQLPLSWVLSILFGLSASSWSCAGSGAFLCPLRLLYASSSRLLYASSSRFLCPLRLSLPFPLGALCV